jgi:hypothetical protein
MCVPVSREGNECSDNEEKMLVSVHGVSKNENAKE